MVDSDHMILNPQQTILKPNEERKLLIGCRSTPAILTRAPGKLAVLQAIYTDEILRQKMKR